MAVFKCNLIIISALVFIIHEYYSHAVKSGKESSSSDDDISTVHSLINEDMMKLTLSDDNFKNKQSFVYEDAENDSSSSGDDIESRQSLIYEEANNNGAGPSNVNRNHDGASASGENAEIPITKEERKYRRKVCLKLFVKDGFELNVDVETIVLKIVKDEIISTSSRLTNKYFNQTQQAVYNGNHDKEKPFSSGDTTIPTVEEVDVAKDGIETSASNVNAKILTPEEKRINRRDDCLAHLERDGIEIHARNEVNLNKLLNNEISPKSNFSHIYIHGVTELLSENDNKNYIIDKMITPMMFCENESYYENMELD